MRGTDFVGGEISPVVSFFTLLSDLTPEALVGFSFIAVIDFA